MNLLVQVQNVYIQKVSLVKLVFFSRLKSIDVCLLAFLGQKRKVEIVELEFAVVSF